MMRYLTVSADYDSTGIKDLNEGELDESHLALNAALWAKIKKWVNDYQIIIPMNNAERAASDDLISKLDDQGLEICREILSHLDDVKVEYYSEGRLRKLQP